MSRRRTGPVFRDGKVHVRRRMCDTCIFRPGNQMALRPGVRDALVAEAAACHSCIPCHESLDGLQSVCAGFYRLHATVPLIVANATGIIEWTK